MLSIEKRCDLLKAMCVKGEEIKIIDNGREIFIVETEDGNYCISHEVTKTTDSGEEIIYMKAPMNFYYLINVFLARVSEDRYKKIMEEM